MAHFTRGGGRIIPRFFLAGIVEFLVYYLITLFISSFDFIYYYLYFVERFVLLVIPVMAAVVVYIRCDTRREVIKTSLYIALTRLIVFIPFFYLEYVYGIYDSIEAILLSLLSSLAAVVIYFIVILVAHALTKHMMSKHKEIELPAPLLDTSAPATKVIFTVSLLIFLINLALEIYSTVIFFMENGTIYYINEIVLMIASYVYLAIMLLGIHLIGVVTLNRSFAKIEE